MTETAARWRRATALMIVPVVGLAMGWLLGVSPAHAATTTTETSSNTGGDATGPWQFPSSPAGGSTSGLATLAESGGDRTGEGFAFRVGNGDGDGDDARLGWDLTDIIGGTDTANSEVTDSSISLAEIDSKVWEMDVRAVDESGAPVAPADIQTEFSSTGAPVGRVTSTAKDNGDGSLRVSIVDSAQADEDGSTGHFTTVTFSVADGVIGGLQVTSFHELAWSNDEVRLSANRVVTTYVPPSAAPDSATTQADTPVDIPLLSNDTAGDGAIDPALTTLLNGAGDPVDSVEVPDVGTFTVDESGNARFDPASGYSGTTEPVPYRITDKFGQTAESTLTVTVAPPGAEPPTARQDYVTTSQATGVDLAVLENDTPGDAPIDPALTKFLDADGNPVDSLELPDVGTFEVRHVPTAPDGVEHKVTFIPDHWFTGDVPTVSYRITDEYGNTATSTVTVTVTADPPVANPDTATTTQGTAVELGPLYNDIPGAVAINEAGTRLVDADGALVKTVTISGVGTFTVDGVSNLEFVPEPDFTGRTPAVTYQIIDEFRQTDRSTITITVTPSDDATPPAAGGVDDVGTTPAGTPVVIDPVSNDKAGDTPLDRSTVRLLDPRTDDPVTELVLDAGRFVVDGQGRITFTPADGFVGEVPPVTYTVADANGVETSATVRITVSGPAASQGSDTGQSVTGPAAAGPTLAATGSTGEVAFAGVAAVALLGAGVGLLLVHRHRRPGTDG